MGALTPGRGVRALSPIGVDGPEAAEFPHNPRRDHPAGRRPRVGGRRLGGRWGSPCRDQRGTHAIGIGTHVAIALPVAVKKEGPCEVGGHGEVREISQRGADAGHVLQPIRHAGQYPELRGWVLPSGDRRLVKVL